MVEAWQLARSTDPDTSHAAAHSLDRTPLLALVLGIVRDDGPATVSEVADVLGINQWRASKRMSDLKNDRLVEDSGHRRLGHSGRLQIVWQYVDTFGGDDPW